MRLAEDTGTSHKGGTPIDLRQSGLMRCGEEAEVRQKEPTSHGNKSRLDAALYKSKKGYMMLNSLE